MPAVINPLLSSDIETSMNYFETNLRNGDTVPEYMSVLRTPVTAAKEGMRIAQGMTTTYPKSSKYNSDEEEPNKTKDFMKKYSQEYGTSVGWYDSPGFDTDLRNLDMTPAAAGLFTSFDTIGGALNNIKLTGDMLECLAFADPQALMQMFMSWGPPQLVRVVAFVKSGLSIYKTKVNSFRDAIMGLLFPILLRPLMTSFVYLDQMVSLGVGTTQEFVRKLSMTDNVFCTLPWEKTYEAKKYDEGFIGPREQDPNEKAKEQQKESKMEDIRSTLKEAATYIEEGTQNVVGWYVNCRDDIIRAITANGDQIRDAAAVIKKVVITKKVIDIIRDSMEDRPK